MLSDRLDYDAYSCLCIGSAGEDLLPAATVISDGRAAGGAGFGAVLGWKNLKAITVQKLTEVISASGLCIFTAISCLDIQHSSNPFTDSSRLARLLRYSTGIVFSQEELIAVGNDR